MSADLHIHLADGLTEDDFRCFFRGTIGSKWCQKDHDAYMAACSENNPTRCSHWDHMMNSFAVWVGEVSWLKAALFEDNDRYVPNPIGTISDLFDSKDELVTITPELIDKVTAALQLPNQTKYTIADPQSVIEFLERFVGHKAFTISW